MIDSNRKNEIIDKLLEYVSEHCISEEDEYNTFINIIGLSKKEMKILGIELKNELEESL